MSSIEVEYGTIPVTALRGRVSHTMLSATLNSVND
jgi:hypothetical protein